jgi:negative regulator of sigma-B (phosphoserine phosphatase)
MEVGVAERPLAGQAVSGDLAVVRAFPPSGLLITAIDGLGHGLEAARAARAAELVLTTTPQWPVRDLISACHHAMRSTRGAVMSLVSVDASIPALAWTGLGNVEACLVRVHAPRERLLLHGGVVGHREANPRVATLGLSPGDLLVLVTDGVRSTFLAGVAGGGTAKEIADRILAEHHNPADDALVVVARFLGPDP